MKTLVLLPALAGFVFSGQALADEGPNTGGQPAQASQIATATIDSESRKLPVRLSATDLDRVTAGVGRNNVANEPWPALLEAGFTLNHNPSADQGVIDHAGFIGVAVPSAVPNSFCVAFC